MADHVISLTKTEEDVYQQYLAIFKLSDASVLERIKTSLLGQATQSINEEGAKKFRALPISDKASFITKNTVGG